jgi:hypothetical protein
LSLEVKGYLTDQLKDNDTRQAISQAFGGLTTGINSLSDASKSASSFGISIGLGLLGVALAKKYRKSRAARTIAKIFGVDVTELDKQFVLDKLKNNRDFFVELQKKITNALTAGTIDEVQSIFAKEFDLPSLDDAMEVYLQIKDIVLDSVIIGNIMNISDVVSRIETLFGGQTQNIRNAFDAELKTYSVNIAKHIDQAIKNMNEGFRKELDKFQLLQSNLRLITSLSLGTREFREGNTNCWIRGHFGYGDIRNGYDARRPITDAIIESVENNNATILFGDGYCGKSVILMRVALEEIEREYAVLLGDSTDMISKPDQLYDLINRISEDYPKLLLVADNVHKIGGESIFGVFNKIEPGKIKFLFAAREKELKMDKNEIGRAFENIPPEAQYRIGFDLTDALLFIRKAIYVKYKIDAKERHIQFAKDLYKFSKGDPFMFNLGIKYLLSEGKETYEDFITLDIKQKIEKLNEIVEQKIENWKASLLCYVVGIAGIPLSVQNSSDLLGCCGVLRDNLESLAKHDFLIKQVGLKQEQYRTRHEKYAIEFLTYLYHEEFGNNPDYFDQTRGIRGIIKCVWNNIGVNRIIDLLDTCSLLFKNEAYENLSQLMTHDYVVPYDRFITSAQLTELEKARLFCYAGEFLC